MQLRNGGVGLGVIMARIKDFFIPYILMIEIKIFTNEMISEICFKII